MRSTPVAALFLAATTLISCNRSHEPPSNFIVVHADHTISGVSSYPVAADAGKVGTYPANTHSGAGYFYDDVLEYRVWLHPDKGAKRLNGNDDYFAAFAQYELADAFSKATSAAEQPIVLVRQLEWISEPDHGRFIPMKEDRITEWQVQWLIGNKRAPSSIQEFRKHPKEAGP